MRRRDGPGIAAGRRGGEAAAGGGGLLVPPPPRKTAVLLALDQEGRGGEAPPRDGKGKKGPAPPWLAGPGVGTEGGARKG